MIDFYQAFTREFERLKQLDCFVEYEQSAQLIPMNDYELFTNEAKFFFNALDVQELKRLQKIPERVSLYWGYNNGDEEINGGEFNCTNALVALVNNQPRDMSYVLTEEQIHQFRIIDTHPHTGDGTIVFIELDPNLKFIELPLYFMNGNGRLSRMEMNYFEYLDKLLVIKSYYNWHLLYLQKDRVDDGDRKYIAENSFSNMDTIIERINSKALPIDILNKINAFK